MRIFLQQAQSCEMGRRLGRARLVSAYARLFVGAKRLDQLQDNLAAVELTLTQDELRQLDEVNALAPEYPGWVLPFQGAHRLGQVIAWSFTRGEPAALIQSVSI